MGTLSFPDGLYAYSAYSALQVPLRSSKPGFRGTALINTILGRDTPDNVRKIDLGSKWGPALQELQMLSKERDAKVFYYGLLEIGRRLEADDQEQLAHQIYSTLTQTNSEPFSVPCEVYERARERMDTMVGVGDCRKRLAYNLERLPISAARWDKILAMAGAGLAFRGVKLLATLGWTGSFESAIALQAASTSVAFFAETAAYVSLDKSLGTLAGYGQDWSSEAFFKEWAGGAEMLLGLKSMGAFFGRLSQAWARGESTLDRVTRGLAPQAGMFSGIMIGNRLAELSGLHPERRGDTWWVDGLTTLLDFNIAGRWLHVLTGSPVSKLEAWSNIASASISLPRSNQVGLLMSLGLESSGLLPISANGPVLPIIMSAEPPDLKTGVGIAGKSSEKPGAGSCVENTSVPSLSSILRLLLLNDFPHGSYESMSIGLDEGIEFTASRRSNTIHCQIGLSNISIKELLPLLNAYFDFRNPKWRESKVTSFGEHTSFVLPEDFPHRLVTWGDEYLEQTIDEFAPHFSRVLDLNQKNLRGEALDPSDRKYLTDLYEQVVARSAAFNRDYSVIRLVVGLGEAASGSDPTGQRKALRRITHDLTHRIEILSLLNLSVEILKSGEALDDLFVSRLQPHRGFLLSEALEAGVSISTTQFPGAAEMVGAVCKSSQLQGLHLNQGRPAVQALADIVGNLLTNAWRYRSEDPLKVMVRAEKLSDGSLEISFKDNGIGIRSENIARLGGEGFREARKQVQGSHGYGLGSVISNLRALDWGPLWVKSHEGAGSEFRFVIPQTYLASDDMASEASLVVSRPTKIAPENTDQRQREEGFIAPDACFSSSVPNLKAAPKAPTDK